MTPMERISADQMTERITDPSFKDLLAIEARRMQAARTEALATLHVVLDLGV